MPNERAKEIALLKAELWEVVHTLEQLSQDLNVPQTIDPPEKDSITPVSARAWVIRTQALGALRRAEALFERPAQLTVIEGGRHG